MWLDSANTCDCYYSVEPLVLIKLMSVVVLSKYLRVNHRVTHERMSLPLRHRTWWGYTPTHRTDHSCDRSLYPHLSHPPYRPLRYCTHQGVGKALTRCRHRLGWDSRKTTTMMMTMTFGSHFHTSLQTFDILVSAVINIALVVSR